MQSALSGTALLGDTLCVWMESPWDLNDEGKVVTSNVNLEGYCPETAPFTLIYNCSYLPRKRSGLDKN